MPPRRGWNSFWFWFYKYAAPDGAGERFDNSPAIHGWVKRQQNEKVPRGTAENEVVVRKHLSSRTGLWKIADHESQP